MNISGMHLSNANDRMKSELMELIGADGPVTMLHMQVAEWFDRLRKMNKDRLIHVRIYKQWWKDTDPTELARWFVRDLGRLLDDPRCLISPANEQNIEYKAGPDTLKKMSESDRIEEYRHIGRWNMKFWREIDRLRPKRRALALWSALADGHDAFDGVADSEYQVPEIREAVEYCDVLAAHPYGHLNWFKTADRNSIDGKDTVPGGASADWFMLRPYRPAGAGGPSDPGGILAQFPGRPLFISETGCFQVPDTDGTADALHDLAAFAANDARTIGITPFIWSSDDVNWVNRLTDNPDLVRALIENPNYAVRLPIPRARRQAGIIRRDPVPAAPPLSDSYRAVILHPGESLYKHAGPRWRECRRVVPILDVRDIDAGSIIMIPNDIPVRTGG